MRGRIWTRKDKRVKIIERINKSDDSKSYDVMIKQNFAWIPKERGLTANETEVKYKVKINNQKQEGVTNENT